MVKARLCFVGGFATSFTIAITHAVCRSLVVQ